MKFQSIVLASALSMVVAVPAFSQGGADTQQGGSDQSSSQSGTSSSEPSDSSSQSNQAGQSSSSSGQSNQVSANDARQSIKNVQVKLKQGGYYRGRVDGVWGPRSAAALKKFQQAQSLQASGTMDQQTAQKMGLSSSDLAAFEAAAGQPSGGQGSQGSQGSQSTPSEQNSNGSSDQSGKSGSDSTQ